MANGDGTGRAIDREATTLADAQKAVGTAWASSSDTGLKRINVAVGIGLNGGSQEVESLKAKDLAKDEKINQLEKESGEFKQKYEEVKRENAEINKRLDQIERIMTRVK